jgi:lipid II:glycine glycyltransferase (peptidoglycan interpeptide bridge formation enzyme)
MRESFLNTEAWAEFQRSIGHPTWRFDNGKIRANIIRHNVGFGRNYLYIPHGPVLDVNAMQAVKNELTQFTWFLRRLAKEQKSMFVKMEPQADTAVELIQSHAVRLKKSSKLIQPRRSLTLDLSLSDEELMSQMHHKTRYNIQLAQRKGLEFRESTDIGAFWNLMQKTTTADGFAPHPRDFYEKLLALEGELETKLFFVYNGETPLAGMILLIHDGAAYYLHGAMDREFKSLMAPYLMQWEAIRLARTRGCALYDFWGIDSNRWPGVTRFKLGFGGKHIEYPGAFDLVISRFWYFMYNLVRKFR